MRTEFLWLDTKNIEIMEKVLRISQIQSNIRKEAYASNHHSYIIAENVQMIDMMAYVDWTREFVAKKQSNKIDHEHTEMTR